MLSQEQLLPKEPHHLLQAEPNFALGQGLGPKMPPVFHGSCPGRLGHGVPVFHLVHTHAAGESLREVKDENKENQTWHPLLQGRGRRSALWHLYCYMWDGRIAPTLPWMVTHRPDKGMENEL